MATTQVSVARNKAHISVWPYTAPIDIQYKRISLPALKARYGEVIRADLPSTTRELVSIYLHSNGLFDRSEQFADGPVSQLGSLTLAVEGDQFLIHGIADFVIKPLQRFLAQVIKVTTVNGFRSVNDFQTDATAELLTQVQALNTTTLPYEFEPPRMTLSTPLKLNSRAEDNTSITVTASGDGYYLGDVTVVYSRYDFGWGAGGSQHYMEGPSLPTTQYMVAEVERLTGFPVSLDDVEIETYANVALGELATLTIFFKAESLRYTGELTIDYRAV